MARSKKFEVEVELPATTPVSENVQIEVKQPPYQSRPEKGLDNEGLVLSDSDSQQETSYNLVRDR